MSKMRLLFVDDEPAIRATLPAILSQEGFEVAVAATVAEGLKLLQLQRFDVLLTDLNIDSPGDGFTLVGAMRRVQPEAMTFIITGYPDFETALEAIRKQVDDYFTKPADIRGLVSAIKQRVLNPRRLRTEPTRRVSEILREHSSRITELWLAEVMVDSKLSSVPMTDKRRINQLPELIDHLTKSLETEGDEISEKSRNAAARHGQSRAREGYSTPLLLTEARILTKVIGQVMQENLLVVDLSTLVPDVLRIGEFLSRLLEESLQAFEQTRSPRVA